MRYQESTGKLRQHITYVRALHQDASQTTNRIADVFWASCPSELSYIARLKFSCVSEPYLPAGTILKGEGKLSLNRRSFTNARTESNRTRVARQPPSSSLPQAAERNRRAPSSAHKTVHRPKLTARYPPTPGRCRMEAWKTNKTLRPAVRLACPRAKIPRKHAKVKAWSLSLDPAIPSITTKQGD